MNPKVTKTIVQELDEKGNVISEVITTIEECSKQDTDDTHYGLYL